MIQIDNLGVFSIKKVYSETVEWYILRKQDRDGVKPCSMGLTNRVCEDT